MESHPSNRRIGERLPTPDLTVLWRVTRKGRFRTRAQIEPVRVVNASATGAGLIAPTVPDLVRRSTIQLDCGGFDLEARVTRVEPTAEVDVTYYGVQFMSPTSEAIDYLLARGGGDDRSELENFWLRAH